jgi:hypothetical protein
MSDVFVFGSNRAGQHGAGAALDALNLYGAIYGQGEGVQGNSYAIPTKDAKLRPLTLAEIRTGVERFINYARMNPGLYFQITQVGCGYAGKSAADIAPMFRHAPPNCSYDTAWGIYFTDQRTFWGHQ